MKKLLASALFLSVVLLAGLFQGGGAPLPCAAAGGEGGGGGGPSGSPLPPTGQTACYHEDGTEDPECDDPEVTGDCPGQDRVYQAGCSANPRFVLNDGGTPDMPGMPVDDTVTDNCTGLMWQMDTADTRGPDGSLVPDGVITQSECFSGVEPICCARQEKTDFEQEDQGDDIRWCDALDYCENLIFATHDDWRLPNIQELQSIVDYSLRGPAIDTTFGVSLTPATPVPFGGPCELRYWSSTRGEDGDEFDPDPGTQLAYNVAFATGSVTNNRRDFLQYVRAVRSVAAAGAGAASSERGGDADGDGARRGGGAGPMCVADTDNGNVNGDSARDLSDAVYELAWLFQGGPEPEPFCIAAGAKMVGCAVDNGNTNGDAARDLSDVIYLLAWLFQGGLAPVGKCGGTPPPEICDDLGVDEDGDGLTDCEDPDCNGTVGCPGPEICTGGFDEDGDGDIDCADSDCFAVQPEDPSLLPDTGVTRCWNVGNETPADCAVAQCKDAGCGTPAGQDGFYETGCASDGTRFDDSANDGTVTDNCTGLMWQKDTVDIDGGGVDPSAASSDRISWCDALFYCEVTLNTLALGGHTDWRLPNIREIQSIVDHSEGQDVGVFPPFNQVIRVNVDPDDPAVQYWSSTSLVGASTSTSPSAWLVTVTGLPAVTWNSRDKRHFVRAVRDAP